MQSAPKKLLDQVRDAIRLKHYAYSTKQAYVQWIKRFILFHDKRHPEEMGRTEVEAFLTHLAVKRHVAASTQNQAFSAILFLYRDVLRCELDFPIDALRATKPKHLPTVLTKEEVPRVLGHLSGAHQLMANLLYGSGLRLMECLRLRVKDLDFAQRQVIVRDGKGMEDRVTMLPNSLVAPLQEHLQRVKRLHEEDLAKGYGAVYLPYALERKYPTPCASGPGSTSSPRTGFPLTCAAITWTRAACRRPSARQHVGRASTSPSAPALSATALPPICLRMATISAPCKSC